MIYRIADTHDWDAAQLSGIFASVDLTVEGFIHCCTVRQIAAVANRYYQGRGPLLLLEIDETAIPSPLQWEDFTHSGQVYPHVYGPIPRDTIRRCLTLYPCADGHFVAPSFDLA